ncbi:MAG: hypothetical protein ACKVU1_10910 [bacterium]
MRRLVYSLLLFAFLLGVYHANGDFLPGNDAKPNVYLAESVLREGNLAFTPREMPFMFLWTLHTPAGAATTRINAWTDVIGERTADDLLAAGQLSVEREHYYLVPSVRPNEYVGAFGPGAGLCALPVFAAIDLVSNSTHSSPAQIWYGGKLAASLCVAGSALLVFHTALLMTTVRRALVIALAYGLGTCVWSMSSQQLYQHGPMELFLALGTFFIVRGGLVSTSRRDFAFSGLAYATAALCRPTGVLVVAAIAAYLALSNRRALAAFATGALPGAAALCAYNAYFLGSPFAFSQGAAGDALAIAKTGAPGVWQTPLWLGAAGMLASPSRGLFVFSPFLLAAFAGVRAAWRSDRFAALRPLSLATLAVWLVEFKHFDWWSGWSFGYRHIVDTCVLLAPLLVPALDAILRRRALTAIFALLLAWSVGVQFIGAFAYDLWGWNNAIAGYELALPGSGETIVAASRDEANALMRTRGATIVREIRQNIDMPENHHRLWSIADSQIVFYARRFAESRAFKHEFMRQWLENPAL